MNYYRYAKLHFADKFMLYAYDTMFFSDDGDLESIHFIDSMNYCPNGFGLYGVGEYCNIDVGSWNQFSASYLKNPLPRTDRLYGVALMVDSALFGSAYDTLTIRVFKMSDDQTQMVALDSVALTMNTIGVSRYMYYPLADYPFLYYQGPGHLPDGVRTLNTTMPDVVPCQYCLRGYYYQRIVEVYFDEPMLLDEDEAVYLNARISGDSLHIVIPIVYAECGSNREIPIMYPGDATLYNDYASSIQEYYRSDCSYSHSRFRWNSLFPIIAPLPNWENNKMDSVFVHWDDIASGSTDVEDSTDISGINLSSPGFRVKVYPNPATDKLRITSDQTIVEYELYDMTGKILRNGSTLSHDVNIDVSVLRGGVYQLKLTSTSGTTVRKVQVIR